MINSNNYYNSVILISILIKSSNFLSKEIRYIRIDCKSLKRDKFFLYTIKSHISNHSILLAILLSSEIQTIRPTSFRQ